MMSRPPSFSIPALTKLSAKPGFVTSPLTATASPPSALISSTTAWPGASSRSLTTTLAPWRASLSAMERPMPRPEPDTRATFPARLFISFSSLESDDGFAGKFDVSGFVLGGESKPRALLAIDFEEFGDSSLAADLGAELRDRDEARRQRAQSVRTYDIGEGLPEHRHHEHALRKHVRESRLLGEVDVDMHRIVVAGRASVESERR